MFEGHFNRILLHCYIQIVKLWHLNICNKTDSLEDVPFSFIALRKYKNHLEEEFRFHSFTFIFACSSDCSLHIVIKFCLETWKAWTGPDVRQPPPPPPTHTHSALVREARALWHNEPPGFIVKYWGVNEQWLLVTLWLYSCFKWEAAERMEDRTLHS